MKKTILFILLLNTFALNANATHIRAGELSYKHLSGNTYEVTFNQYAKTSRAVPRDYLSIKWGDNTSGTIPLKNTILNVSSDTELRIFKTVHSFSTTGNSTVSVFDENRNANILNINNGNSVAIAFY